MAKAKKPSPNLVYGGLAKLLSYHTSTKETEEGGLRKLIAVFDGVWRAEHLHTFSGIENLEEFKRTLWTDDGNARLLGLTSALFDYRCEDHVVEWCGFRFQANINKFIARPLAHHCAAVEFRVIAEEPDVKLPDMLFEQLMQTDQILISPDGEQGQLL